MSTRLRWGILGSGRIAGIFAQGVARSQAGALVAVGSRDEAKARDFATRFSIPTAHGSYEALLADPSVDAVYIATPHPQHLEWILAAAAARKHVLCEKPLTLNATQARQAVEACRSAGVLLMEAFMYRCHPQTAKVLQILKSGALGEIGLVQATFSFAAPFDPEARLFNPLLGGGGILDVGCYTTSVARLIAGLAEGQPYAEPEYLAGTAVLHPETGVDTLALADLRFGSGLLAQLSCGITLGQESFVRIYGSEGWMLLTDPFIPAVDGGVSRIQMYRAGSKCPDMVRVESAPLYSLEADAFAAALAAGQREVPQIPLGDTLGNLETLDRWRAAIGLKYPAE